MPRAREASVSRVRRGSAAAAEVSIRGASAVVRVGGGAAKARGRDGGGVRLPPGPYSVIMADPPWRYSNPRAIVAGGPGATQVDVESQYGTMPLGEIRALPVTGLATKDAFLFLWTTNPFLADGSAASVVSAWGFRPKTVITWAKTRASDGSPSMSVGHWFRSASEHIIFAVRGSPRRPAGFPALPTWQPHGRLGHSVKPDAFYALAERFAGDGRCLEMFARRSPRSRRWDV